MAFWDFLSGMGDWDWSGILKGAAGIGIPLLTGYLTSREKGKAYQPGVPSYGTTGYELYNQYGDPAAMEARIRAQMGGPPIGPGEIQGPDPFYDEALKASIIQEMSQKGMAGGMSLQDYLAMMDKRTGGLAEKEGVLAAERVLEKVDPRFVGTHGQLGPVGARYVTEAMAPIRKAGLEFAGKAPLEFGKLDVARQAAVTDAIKAGMAKGLSWAQIQTTIEKINAEWNISLSKMIMEAHKQQAVGVGEMRGGITGGQGPGKLDWLSALPWEDWQGTLSGMLDGSKPSPDFSGTGPFMGLPDYGAGYGGGPGLEE